MAARPENRVPGLTDTLLTDGPESRADGVAVDVLRQARQRYSRDALAGQLGVSSRTVSRWESGDVPLKKVQVLALRYLVSHDAASRLNDDDAEFRFIDLFAGIGGTRIAMESQGGRCVFTCERDRFCQQTYLANFDSEHPIAGDIRQVHEDEVPDFDVLVGGFPCQPFSIAGVSKKNSLGNPHGFACEAQGTLFFEVARLIRARRPAAFLLENVRNLERHDRGRTCAVIRRTLTEDLGYDLHWRVIDARGVVPQHRERVFLVGFREPMAFDWNRLELPEREAGPKLGTILHPEDGSEEAEPHFTEGRKATVAPRYVLSRHLWTYLKDYARKHRAAGNGFGYGLVGPDDVARTLSARYYKDGSEILVSRGARKNPRRLTPRECARLMGFDAALEAPFRIPVSDTQAYRQFGNSVVVPVVQEVARLMRPFVRELVQPRGAAAQPQLF